MDKYREHLNQLAGKEGLRHLRNTETWGPFVKEGSRDLLNLSSNDYLGLGSDRILWDQFIQQPELWESTPNFPVGACSSRLLTGNHPVYQRLEKKLAETYHAESALILNSGYHANLGILPALTTSEDLILSDKLVHASLIDGIHLSSAKSLRYPHQDMNRLESLLQKHRNQAHRIFIVTESIFSMDGDCADLDALVFLKQKYGAYIYLDEAHAVGVRGENGLGMAEEKGLLHEVDLLVGTFGKAIASQGAFLISSQLIREYLINTLRTLIFTTGLPPFNLQWTEWVFDHLSGMKSRRVVLRQQSDHLRNLLKTAGWITSGESHIVPVYFNNNEEVVKASVQLNALGYYILPIRSPAVPRGTERLRISMTASIPPSQIENLCTLWKPIGK